MTSVGSNFSVDVHMELTPSSTYVHLSLTHPLSGRQKWMAPKFN